MPLFDFRTRDFTQEFTGEENKTLRSIALAFQKVLTHGGIGKKLENTIKMNSLRAFEDSTRPLTAYKHIVLGHVYHGFAFTVADCYWKRPEVLRIIDEILGTW